MQEAWTICQTCHTRLQLLVERFNLHDTHYRFCCSQPCCDACLLPARQNADDCARQLEVLERQVRAAGGDPSQSVRVLMAETQAEIARRRLEVVVDEHVECAGLRARTRCWRG